MARRVGRGDIWLYRFAPPDKRRPVLILSRPEAIKVLRTVTVAPITSTIRDLPSEVRLDQRHGMKGPCAINLDHVQTVPQEDLRRYIGTVDREILGQVCRALAIAVGCG